ncbi:MAG TPA: hypothetical protein PL183_06845 [Aquamicrobium sp.]|nr:hypothetical protein [Aquamicrobium sp.]
MGAFRPAGGVGRDAGEGAARAAPDDLLARAMVSVGLDFDRLSRRDSPWLREMRLTCRSCNARGRYRHYCANADSFALLAAAERSLPRQEPRQEH